METPSTLAAGITNLGRAAGLHCRVISAPRVYEAVPKFSKFQVHDPVARMRQAPQGRHRQRKSGGAEGGGGKERNQVSDL